MKTEKQPMTDKERSGLIILAAMIAQDQASIAKTEMLAVEFGNDKVMRKALEEGKRCMEIAGGRARKMLEEEKCAAQTAPG